MAKPDNPAEASAAARPPRPVQRVRFDAPPEGEAGSNSPNARERSSLGSSATRGSATRGSAPRGHAVARDAEHALAGHATAGGLEGRAPRERIDDAFDTTRNLQAPYLEEPYLDEPYLETSEGFLSEADAPLADDGFEAEGAGTEAELHAEPDFADDDGLYDGAGQHGADGDDATWLTPSRAAVAARSPSGAPRPGLGAANAASGPASAAPRVSSGSADFSGFGAPSAGVSRVPKLPMASLERPSTSRLDLTPSPVPRVALAPATGAVDISLVPGPHTIGSRNLPTLAAQHLLGRRAPRRPAPAVTLPPPATREARVAFTLARDVRSSKSEIVLGLTIGLGVSLLLAGLGQAYLRSEPIIADGPSPPTQLESVTLSARPELAAASTEAAPSAGAVAASNDGAAAASGAIAGARTLSARSRHGAAAPAAADEAAGSFDAPASAARDSMLLAQATGQRGQRTPPRATPERAARARRSQAVSNAASGSGGALESGVASAPAVRPSAAAPSALPAPVSAPSLPPPSEAPAASAPLTPAESAGLGLDLPL